MDSIYKKNIITINNKYQNWNFCLISELRKVQSSNIEINCKDIELSCKDILFMVTISKKYNCKIISFCSTSPKTIVSIQSLGYPSQFIFQNDPNNSTKIKEKNIDLPKSHFHQGTVRSGEYIESSGDLLILGDVNPGAIVSAAGNVIIWGRLLGIAHAGNKGNSYAKIAALQLRPLQIRIANIVARGPKESPQLGLAEQATIDSEKIIISPLDTTSFNWQKANYF